MTPPALTQPQWRALFHVRDVEERRHDCFGACPSRGQEALYMRLHRMKLLKFVGWGVTDDRPDLRVRLYHITVRGRRALERATP